MKPSDFDAEDQVVPPKLVSLPSSWRPYSALQNAVTNTYFFERFDVEDILSKTIYAFNNIQYLFFSPSELKFQVTKKKWDEHEHRKF